jgi:hypothetical protein
MAKKKTPAKKSAPLKKAKTAAKKPSAAAKKKPAAKATAKAKPAAKVKPPAKAKPTRRSASAVSPAATTSHPYRNSDFPNTYIKLIDVALDDPDHWVRLTWTGPKASAQETGPFRSSPGAGNKGLNCDLGPTSRRSGSHCTPKGTRSVEGFARRLNSDARAEYVTWFHRGRGIAFHYFPVVPKFPASHGCVRLETKRIARLIQDNSRAYVTKVTVGGTWKKPARQW